MTATLDRIANATTTPRHAPQNTAALLRAIDALGPMLRAAARDVETHCRVPQSHIDAIRATGLFDLVKPAAYGGREGGFDVLVEATMRLARHCASTAWVSGLLAAHQWLLAGFPAQAQADVWSQDADALICGSYAPAAKATRVEGGLRVSGKWSFASGSDCAQWAFCAALMPQGTDGATLEPAFMLVPRADYTIADTWDVIGLAGTGSKTLVLDDVFVPSHRLLTFTETTSGRTPGARVYADVPSYRIPMLTMIPSCLACVAVGSAEGALDDYLEMTGARVTRGAVAGAHQKMAEFATVQLRVAEAAASTDAARTVLLRDLRDVATKAAQGQEVSAEDRITCRRGQSFAVSLALRSAEALNASTGGQGLSRANNIQRAWRDVNAVARHISLNWDAVGTMYGQLALGLPPKGQY